MTMLPTVTHENAMQHIPARTRGMWHVQSFLAAPSKLAVPVICVTALAGLLAGLASTVAIAVTCSFSALVVASIVSLITWVQAKDKMLLARPENGDILELTREHALRVKPNAPVLKCHKDKLVAMTRALRHALGELSEEQELYTLAKPAAENMLHEYTELAVYAHDISAQKDALSRLQHPDVEMLTTSIQTRLTSINERCDEIANQAEKLALNLRSIPTIIATGKLMADGPKLISHDDDAVQLVLERTQAYLTSIQALQEAHDKLPNTLETSKSNV